MTLNERALWTWSYGLYIVTARAGGRANGQIANAVSQVTAMPPRVAVAVNHENFTHNLIRDSAYFGISVLASSVPMEVIGLFGFKSGRDVDKLSQVAVRQGECCPLVVEHVVAVSEAKVIQQLDVGTHTLFVGEVVAADVISEVAPLTYVEYHARKGRAPKNAPTYRGEADAPKPAPTPATRPRTYTCSVCGYTYDPRDGDPKGDVPPGTAFEDLPDDWVCPVCGAEKSAFEQD